MINLQKNFQKAMGAITQNIKKIIAWWGDWQENNPHWSRSAGNLYQEESKYKTCFE